MVGLVPINKVEQHLAIASTPKESFLVEAEAKAGMAYSIEQRDYEKAFKYAVVYIRAQCNTTELILPTIRQGQYGRESNDMVTFISDYGFTKMQWQRRKKILEASKKLDEYQDDCIVKGMLPTPYGLVGFYKNPHVAHNSGNDEWYTPAEIIEKAHRVMGGIDLDPASSDIANQIVKASKYFTIDDDGLSHDWHGRVWMNPPYSQPWINRFSNKLVYEIESGHVSDAIVLVNNATETAFFQNMLAISKAICFPKGRMKFIDEMGNPSGAPLQGQALLYFGSKINAEKFTDEFMDIGIVLWSAGQ